MKCTSRLLVAAFTLAAIGIAQPAAAQPAPGPNHVLILGSSVTGGLGSLEAVEATPAGLIPIVDLDPA